MVVSFFVFLKKRPPVFNKILKNGIIDMNTTKIKIILVSLLPSRSKIALFLRITLFLAFFGSVCYLVAGWDLLQAIPAGILTAFIFMLIGEFVLKVLILAPLLYQWWKKKGDNS